jgi:sulfur carrier protein
MVKHRSESLAISVNGERRDVPAGLTVRTLLAHLDVPADRVAVELNRRIVRQPEWDAAAIEAGAEVEIVQFVGGG